MHIFITLEITMRIKKSLAQYFVVFSLITLLMGCNAEATLPFKDVSNNELKSLLNDGVTLVDIRRPEEWKQTGIVEGSKKLTFFFASGRVNPNFMPQIEAMVAKDQPVALICRTGNRTRAASEFLAKGMGYTHVYNVKHGITGWIAEKHPVVADR
jgi:rhodanese-related sulfurtransferase